ncbi:MAG TPA: glycine cleavage system protein GcvH [Deltaproteobacteria bacterium]|nr:glycine cleavage system protein GcvH [Deltaproteobacteria bacterium]
MNIPEQLRYTKDHEWAKIEDNTLRVGITDYAQHEMGDVVYVDLKPTGTKVKKGDPVGTVESVKAVSEVFAPASGTIIETNADLEQSPELVNQDCYGQGWMVVIAFDDAQDLEALMDAKDYEEYLSAEAK